MIPQGFLYFNLRFANYFKKQLKNMIWDVIEQTGFNAHFSNLDTTITTLLLDENIITEFKNENPQLLQYINSRKHDFITELIEYTIVLPEESQGYDRCHRLPFISSELLAIDSSMIYSEFFREGEKEIENQYWNRMLTFLDHQAAHNEILMGYFEKVVSNLYDGNKMKVAICLCQTTVVVAHNLNRFIRLLPNGSVTDIIKSCLILLNVPEGVVLAERKEIQTKIVDLFVCSLQPIRVSCAYILGEVINKFQTFSSGDVLIEQLLSSGTLLKLYQIENSGSVNDLLVALIKKTQQRMINEHDQSVPLLQLSQHHRTGIDKYLIREAEHIRDVSKSTGFIVNQSQTTVRKSNKRLYSLLNLLGLAIQEEVNSFVNEGLLVFLWNLVALYPYNNILHVVVKKIFLGVLKGAKDRRQVFLQSYESSILKITEQNIPLLRPLVYSIWMEAKAYPVVTIDPVILSQFSAFVTQHLEPLVQYEIKNVEHHHNSNQKLVVDQEDRAAPQEEEEMKEQMGKGETGKLEEDNLEEKSGNSKVSSCFDGFGSESVESMEEQAKEEEVKAEGSKEKDGFDFFGEWSGLKTGQKNPAEGGQEERGQEKKDLFDDFSNFG